MSSHTPSHNGYRFPPDTNSSLAESYQLIRARLVHDPKSTSRRSPG